MSEMRIVEKIFNIITSSVDAVELDIDFDKINISTPANKDVKNEPSEVDGMGKYIHLLH